MVGSNTLSGLGRFALCESLESRSLFAVAAFDTAFHGGDTETHFGGKNETAYAGAVLTSGRLLVVGTSELGGVRDVIAVYNKDGYLNNGFDGDGKLILSVATSALIGTPLKVAATPDGGALVFGSVGIAKLLSNGKLDTNFGFAPNSKTGIDSYAGGNVTIRDGYLPGDGTFRILMDVKRSGVAYTDINIYDAVTGEPKFSNSFRKISDQTLFTADGQGAAFVANKGVYSEYGLASNFTRRVNFGNNGVVDLTSSYQKWVTANGPFAVSTGGTLDAKGYPTLNIDQQIATSDGGLLLAGYINATSPNVPQDRQQAGRTLVYFRINSAGRVTDEGNDFTGPEVVFDPGVSDPKKNVQPDGTFYLGDGRVFDVPATNGNVAYTTTVDAGNGATYVIGSLVNLSPNNGFNVARIKPFAQNTAVTITGVLFNDDNGNQERESNETLNVGRTVYLDSNGNYKLDAGERSTVTDANGRYTFNSLPAGPYRVQRVLPSGYRATTESVFYNTPINIIPGATLDLDIGSTNRAAIFGTVYKSDSSGKVTGYFGNAFVFADVNQNGQFDDGEPADTTDGNTGNFFIPAVVAGTYRVVTPTPTGYVATGQPNGYATVTVKSGQVTGISFGFTPIA